MRAIVRRVDQTDMVVPLTEAEGVAPKATP